MFDLHAAVLQGGLEIGLYFKMAESESESVISKSESEYNNNNNNDRLTAFDPGQPG